MKPLEDSVILITGASGFIGRHLVDRLSWAGTRLLISRTEIDRVEPGKNVIHLCSALENLTPEFWTSHNIDQIDYVFHLGAFTPKKGAEADRIEEVIRGNIEGTRKLLDSLPNTPETIIFSSTLDIYALPKDGVPITEASRIEPGTLYGASKFFCERLIRTWSTQAGCRSAILRYGHIYGPGEEAYRKLIPTVISNLLEGRNATIHGDGSALRDYLYVADAVEATVRAAGIKGDSDPINIVRGQSIPLRQVAELLALLTERSGSIEYATDQPNGTSFRFDNSRMRAVLGEWEMTPLETGLKAEIEACRSMTNGR